MTSGSWVLFALLLLLLLPDNSGSKSTRENLLDEFKEALKEALKSVVGGAAAAKAALLLTIARALADLSRL